MRRILSLVSVGSLLAASVVLGGLQPSSAQMYNSGYGGYTGYGGGGIMGLGRMFKKHRHHKRNKYMNGTNYGNSGYANPYQMGNGMVSPYGHP